MKKLFFTLISLFFIGQIYAQLEEIFSARDDAQTYLNHYMNPAMQGFMYDFNNAWYTTGKTHKKWGFDLTISGTASMIPETDQTFVFNPSEYNYLSLSGSNTTLPTAAGGETNAQLTATNENGSITFNALEGLGNEWPEDFFIPISIPSPMVQVGLGLPTKTDVKLRWVPTIHRNEVTFGLVGLGAQHDLTQYFDIIDKVPGLSISVLGAFTNAHVDYLPKDTGVAGQNQKLEMRINTYTLQAIGDLDVKFVNFYLGMGYTAGKTNLDALGTYQYDFNNDGVYNTDDETIVDPLQMAFTMSGFKTTAGVRFNLGPVKLFADYTLQKYNALTAGLAISIR
jgi:hypothetical protein